MLKKLQFHFFKEGWIRLLFGGFIALVSMFIIPAFSTMKAEVTEAESNQAQVFVYKEEGDLLLAVQENTLRSVSSVPQKKEEHDLKRLYLTVTAYSSTPCQTYGDPFITASGSRVRDGIVATNLLPFGTKIRIPEIYGDRIFVVEDRMHARNSQNVDVWYSEYWEAKNFGVKQTYIEILE